MYNRGGNNAPAPSAGRGQHLLRPAWMTQGLHQQPGGASSSSPPAPLVQQQQQQQHQQQPIIGGNVSAGSSYGGGGGGAPSSLRPAYQQQHQPYGGGGYSQQQQHGYHQQQQYPQRAGASIQSLPVVLPRPPTSVIPVATHWVESKSPEGRIFYSNSMTGETTYDKPFELKTPAERELPTCIWKEFCQEGRCYFVNSTTKASVWEEPVEYTKFKLRLKSLCAGEMPTKDQFSMAVYQAAQKALDDLVVDLDGSYAKKRAEDEAAAAATVDESETKGKEASKWSTKDFEVVSRSYPPPSAKLIEFEGKGKEVFLEMLQDWGVPASATWEETFSYGIASDPRYNALPTLGSKKALVAERRSASLSTAGEENNRAKAKAEFEAYLSDLETNRKLLGPKSTFAALLPLMTFEKKMPAGVNQQEVKGWFDARVDAIVKHIQTQREQADRAIERAVHDALARIDKSEELSKQELFDRLMSSDQNFVAEHNQLKPEHIKRHCGTYHQRMLEKREAAAKEKENQARDALRKGFSRAFAEGAISTEARWLEVKSDEDLRVTKAPYLVELLLPFAGHETAVEKEFRDAREDARDAIIEAMGKVREVNVDLVNVRKLADVTDQTAVHQLQELEKRYGKAILEKALSEHSRKFQRDKERFFELLTKWVREPKDAVWERVQPMISDRTAYKDMGSDLARKQAFDEFVATRDSRRRSSSRGRSRSRDSRRRRN